MDTVSGVIKSEAEQNVSSIMSSKSDSEKYLPGQSFNFRCVVIESIRNRQRSVGWVIIPLMCFGIV